MSMAVWCGTVVVDNALQRVVSLARSALAEWGWAMRCEPAPVTGTASASTTVPRPPRAVFRSRQSPARPRRAPHASDRIGRRRATPMPRPMRMLRSHPATWSLDGERVAIGNGDVEMALALADEACALGRSLRDPDVECLGLVYRGHALMARRDVAAGLAQHEEAAAVIRLGGVQSWVAGWALCAILYAARHRCDWLRAAQFADAFVEWSHASRMPAFPGSCQLHRAAVLGVQGRRRRVLCTR